MGYRWLPSPFVLTWPLLCVGTETEERSLISLLALIKTLVLSSKGPRFMAGFDFLKTLSPNTVTLKAWD